MPVMTSLELLIVLYSIAASWLAGSGSRESPTRQDYIDQLTTDAAEAQADAAAVQSVAAVPPAPRLQPKKAAAGVQPSPGDSQYINQLLVSMTQPPAPAATGPQQSPQPQPKRRRRKVRPSPSPKPQQEQQQQAQAPTPVADDFVCPPGIICAQSGSRICGNSVCGPTEKCIDGFMCCSKDSPMCNGRCCPKGYTCMAGRCSPPGSKSCGNNVCFPGTDCFNTATGAPVGANATPTAAIGALVCCGTANLLCGSSCCWQGEMCLAGNCRAPGSSLCGQAGAVCAPNQQCIQNTACCAPGSILCGGVCCPNAAQCINNKCEKQGSSACGLTGLICPAGKACVTSLQQVTTVGALAQSTLAACCAPGQQLCGQQCCTIGSTQSCIAVAGVPQCVAAGSTSCGGAPGIPAKVCPANQVCAERPAPTCCQPGETLCNGACCTRGHMCVSNQCVAPNQLICGTTVCRAGQICIGSVAQPLCCTQGDVACGGVCCPYARCRDNQCRAPAPPPPPPPPVVPARGLL